jgi:CDP-diacylglycerol--glycerol-3-phosphate 3-phosphatidyltransferase
MTASTKNLTRSTALNLPNQLTAARLALSAVLFVLMALKLYLAGFVVFILAASTDWVDGYIARRYSMVTTLGRILDPFADKIIICGTFIFLVAIKEMAPFLQAWMVVVIVGRELLVTALRSFLEQRGADFSAVMSGKLKMGAQCLAAGTALFFLSYTTNPATQTIETHTAVAPVAIEWLLHGSIWAAVLLTIYSGAAYVRAAIGMLDH